MSENRGGACDKLVYFLTGVGAGALIALLFAPKSGSELRSEIADATRKGLDYARDTGREIGERASALLHEYKIAKFFSFLPKNVHYMQTNFIK